MKTQFIDVLWIAMHGPLPLMACLLWTKFIAKKVGYKEI